MHKITLYCLLGFFHTESDDGDLEVKTKTPEKKLQRGLSVDQKHHDASKIAKEEEEVSFSNSPATNDGQE